MLARVSFDKVRAVHHNPTLGVLKSSLLYVYFWGHWIPKVEPSAFPVQASRSRLRSSAFDYIFELYLTFLSFFLRFFLVEQIFPKEVEARFKAIHWDLN